MPPPASGQFVLNIWARGNRARRSRRLAGRWAASQARKSAGRQRRADLKKRAGCGRMPRRAWLSWAITTQSSPK
jgi:hypothetical protein